MVFPATPRVLLGEIQVGGTDWANITDDIFSLRSQVSMTRGQPAEASQSVPSQANFTGKNPGGRYSPSNPLSPYFGLIGRNTPLRLSYGLGAYGMVVGDGNGRVECNDSAALSFVGDMDIRVDMELLANQDLVTTAANWSTGNFDIASKLDNVAGSFGWSLITIAGKLRLHWFTTGLTSGLKSADSTVVIPAPATGRRAVRAVLDVDNGAAGWNVLFYTAPTMAGPWTQLGTTVTGAGVTTMFDTPAKVRIGSASAVTAYTHGHMVPATIYSAELRGGVGATTLFASPTLTTQPLDPVPVSPSAFNDAQGNTWSFNGSSDAARVWYGNVDVRFWGELSSLPPAWDASEQDPTVAVEAAGLLRRLGRGTDPAQTGLKDWVLSDKTALTSYYPLDGGEDTTYSLSLGGTYYLTNRFYPFPGLPGVTGIPETARFTYGKDMGPFLGTGMEINATGSASFVGEAGTGDPNAALDFVWNSPAMGVLTTRVADYNNNYYILTLNTDVNAYTAKLEFYNYSTGAVSTLGTTGVIGALADENQQPHHCRLKLTTSGGNTLWEIYFDGASVLSGTLVGATLNGVSATRTYYSRYDNQTVMNLAHWTIWANTNAALIPTAAEFWQAVTAYAGETAGARIQRVCDVGGITVAFIGTTADTAVMGPQYSEGKLAQIRDAESTDMGILTEPRNAFGLQYRTLRSMIGQDPVVTLDHSLGHIAPPFEPTYDDQLTRNDVTVVRREGGTYRLTKETGTLSALDPPAGVGRYRDEVTVNALTDEQLPGFAAWLVAQGTLDEPRFPVITVNLHSSNIQNTVGLEASCLAVSEGDLIMLTNLSALGIYDDVYLLVIGVQEVLSDGGFVHKLVWNCQPGTLYQLTEYSGFIQGNDRFDTSGSTLVTGVSSSATSMSVATAAGGAIWTTTSGEFPFDLNIAGEKIRVTAITGASSPQTFTVSRSLNGVVKAQSAGASVRLWKTPRFAP